MQNRKGISLIVLVITIIVMIIIAGVVIISLNDENSVAEAKKVAFQNEIASTQEALEINLKTREMKDSNFDRYSVNATTEDEIKQYVKKVDKEVVKYLEVQDGMLVLRKIYSTSTDERVLWIKELNIEVGV